jgi:hypothetical protein
MSRQHETPQGSVQASTLGRAARPRGVPVAAWFVLAAALMSTGGSIAGARAAGPEDFQVVGVDAETAGLIASHAADVRRAIVSRFLGTVEPNLWQPRCVVHVHRTAASFRAAVGAPPLASRGATSIEFVHDAISLRRIDVMGDRPNEQIPDALGHELVHVVLADRFTQGPPPRWADEGLALLFDTPEKQRGHETDFLNAASRGQAWKARDLLTLELHPADTGRQRVFYGQSGALVRWFLDRRDAATFLTFLEDADRIGLRQALQAHYGIDSPDDLDRQWRASLPPRAAAAG